MTGKARAQPEVRRVLIVDDHPLVRDALAALVRTQSDLEVAGTAGSVGEALTLLARERPDGLIVDIALPGASGLELIRRVHDRWPALPILVLSMHDERLYAERCLKAGASGYIMKQEPTDRILEALRSVLDGGVHLSHEMTRVLLDRLASGGQRSRLAALSDRELEIYECIGRGMTTREIARALNLSVRTVESHREHLKRKLGLRNSVELVRCATLWVHFEKSAPESTAP